MPQRLYYFVRRSFSEGGVVYPTVPACAKASAGEGKVKSVWMFLCLRVCSQSFLSPFHSILAANALKRFDIVHTVSYFLITFSLKIEQDSSKKKIVNRL